MYIYIYIILLDFTYISHDNFAGHWEIILCPRVLVRQPVEYGWVCQLNKDDLYILQDLLCNTRLIAGPFYLLY